MFFDYIDFQNNFTGRDSSTKTNFRVTALRIISIITFQLILTGLLEAQTQLDKLTPGDGSAESYFGHSVSIDEDVALVGAHFEGSNGWGAGAAYIFRRNGTDWVQEQKIIGSDINTYDFFGTSVDISGDVAVIGAPNDRATGTAYVFRWNGSSWIEEKILQASDGLSNELFGQSVAINKTADLIVVGAPMDGLGEGSAYIFTYNGITWVEQQNIYANDGLAGDKFGFSIDISENSEAILIGETGPNSSGKGHVFVKDVSTWVRISKLLPQNSTYADGFGVSVAISDSFAFIGSRFDDVNFIDAGSVHIYKKQGNNWVWLTKIFADDRHQDQRFGYVSAISDLVIVGATHDNQNGLEAGAAYLFKLNSNSWNQTNKLLAIDGFAEDWFGSSVKLCNSWAIVGSPYDNDMAINSGSAYIFDVRNLTDLNDHSIGLIDKISLQQNYPNPFNPNTKISWQSPIGSWQTLKVYNILGNEVATLLNEYKPAGIYNIEFNGNELTSGVYFYQLKTENYIETKKMILLK